MEEQQEFNYECVLSEETKKIAKDELREDETIREQLLEQFRNWIKKHPLIKNCRMDSIFLLRFLRTKKFSLPIAQSMLERYLSMRQLYPDWFENLSVDEPEIQDIINSGYIVPLLKRDNKGRLIVLFNTGRFDPYKYTPAHLVRTHSVVFEALMENEENQVRGYTYIIDQAGLSMGHISAWTFVNIRKLAYCLQNTIPIRHKNTYIINVPTYGVKFIELAISCLKEKFKNRCSLHTNIEGLKGIIDLKYLPEEYGGEVSYTELIESLKKTMKENRDQINSLKDFEVEIVPNENQSFNDKEIDGIFGSFRKLEVD
ncbi:hypothetical protein M0802_000699 [Mischocyttarus mexicanus]|nr:hypothetical protein M0802_000699 [Mischocyttarus mexicanus]